MALGLEYLWPTYILLHLIDDQSDQLAHVLHAVLLINRSTNAWLDTTTLILRRNSILIDGPSSLIFTMHTK